MCGQVGAIAKNSRSLRNITEQAGDSIWTTDLSGRILYANPAGCRLTGFSAEEMKRKSTRDLLAAEDLPRLRAHLEQHAAIDSVVFSDWRLRRKDGSQADCELMTQRLPDDRYLVIGRDLTARRFAESRMRLQGAALAAAANAIIITDRRGTIEWVNPAFSALSGYSFAEAVGRNPRELVRCGLVPAATYAELWQTILAGQVWQGEFSNRRKDGSVYDESQTITPVVDSDGIVRHFVAIKQDVSERKAKDAELERYRQQLEDLVAERTAKLAAAETETRLILESTADGVYGLDAEGCVTFVNAAACRMLGFSSRDMIGQALHPLVHHTRPDGTPYPESACPIGVTLREGRPMTVSGEVYWRSDGQPLPVIYATHPMLRDERIVGTVVSFIDVSVQAEAEVAKEVALREIERVVRLKSEFLANMSHEIRTPLNAVLGLAQIGVRSSDGRTVKDTFGRILESGRLLLGIVDDILDFSKIEAGKMNIESLPVDLPATVAQAVEAVAERARAKGVELVEDIAGDFPPSCQGDPLRLFQVLANLLSNAVKFTAAGRVTLSARRDGDMLILSVADTGIGMSEDELSRIFTPFEQADGSTTRRFGGTGLGLAITKRIVDMMGGAIAATSRPGQGSRFEVRLPFLEPAGRLAGPQGPAESAGARRGAGGLAGIAVLVAEDNAVNRLVLEEMLLGAGARVALAGNGREAVERLVQAGRGAFDVVLMDVQMPEMDGYEATRRIVEFAPGLPIIGQTAHALAEERDKCLAAGMVAHIAKPVDIDDLVAAIRRHVGR